MENNVRDETVTIFAWKRSKKDRNLF